MAQDTKSSIGFNPLTGISSILTPVDESELEWTLACFNPLTGISSILTAGSAEGDEETYVSFNPLTGISSILTQTNRREGVG